MKSSENLTRRNFTRILSTSFAGGILLGNNLSILARPLSTNDLTIQNVIDLILKTIPGAPFDKTVDTIKSGSADQKVKGIVTTMFSTIEVIKKTAELGANFIIAHEPTFYNHQDETDWLKDNDVYQFKHQLLDKHKITVWRFHDYWHSHRPDGILTGVLKTLGWENYADKEKPYLINIPPSSLKEIVNLTKKKFNIDFVRVIGKPEQVCSKIVVFPGAAGGKRQIETLNKDKPDLFICGELSEWETAEYVRDARAKGDKVSLVVLSHAVSEEAGMKWLAEWLQPKVSEIRVTNIPSGNPFSVM
jgi:putative NIF3 family GTP cyclohydrolase 1 type 2